MEIAKSMRTIYDDQYPLELIDTLVQTYTNTGLYLKVKTQME